jgi:hypothetical protein
MKNYAVLTSHGTILSVISYEDENELIFKTWEQINKHVLVEEIEHVPDEEIGLERSIVVYEKGQTDVPEDEFYLTPVRII